MKARLEFELPPAFEKGECRMCPMFQRVKLGFKFTTNYCPLTDNKHDCPLEIIEEPECESCDHYLTGDGKCKDCGSEINNFEEGFLSEEAQKAVSSYIESISIPTGVNIYELTDKKNEKCKECKYVSWYYNNYPCRDCKDNSNFNCLSNFGIYGDCKHCPVDNSDPFQLPGDCHRCMDIRGM